MTDRMTDQKTEQKPFRARYEIDDGYAGGARPQYFAIRPDELEEDMTDDDLEAFYDESCAEHMQQNIGCSPSRVDEFIEWARAMLAARNQEPRHD